MNQHLFLYKVSKTLDLVQKAKFPDTQYRDYKEYFIVYLVSSY